MFYAIILFLYDEKKQKSSLSQAGHKISILLTNFESINLHSFLLKVNGSVCNLELSLDSYCFAYIKYQKSIRWRAKKSNPCFLKAVCQHPFISKCQRKELLWGHHNLLFYYNLRLSITWCYLYEEERLNQNLPFHYSRVHWILLWTSSF